MATTTRLLSPDPTRDQNSQPPAPPTEFAELEEAQSRIETRLRTEHRRALPMYLIAALMALAGLALVGLPQQIVAKQTIVGVVLLAYGAIFLFGWWAYVSSRIASLRAERDGLAARKRILSRLMPSSPDPSQAEPSYFDRLVGINVENLAAYYTLVKVHTDKSFVVATAAGVVGFALVATGLAFGYLAADSSPHMAYVSSGAGVLTEFIAGVFFYLYNRTVRQLKEYHDSLLAVQNILLSFKLVGDLQASDEKTRMVSRMLAYLVGTRDRPEAPATAVLAGDARP